MSAARIPPATTPRAEAVELLILDFVEGKMSLADLEYALECYDQAEQLSKALDIEKKGKFKRLWRKLCRKK